MAQTNKLEKLLNQNELIDNKIFQLNQNIKQLKLEKNKTVRIFGMNVTPMGL